MTYRDNLISLLCEPENISTALDIEECMWEVRPRLQRRFWKAVYDGIQARFQSEHLIERWSCRPVPGSDPRNQGCETKNDAGFQSVVRYPSAGSPRVHVTLGVWHKDLATVVGFTVKGPNRVMQEITELRRILEQGQFTPAAGNERRYWIATSYHGPNLDDKAFVIGVASDVALVADKAAEPLIYLLANHGERIEALDKALA